MLSNPDQLMNAGYRLVALRAHPFDFGVVTLDAVYADASGRHVLSNGERLFECDSSEREKYYPDYSLHAIEVPVVPSGTNIGLVMGAKLLEACAQADVLDSVHKQFPHPCWCGRMALMQGEKDSAKLLNDFVRLLTVKYKECFEHNPERARLLGEIAWRAYPTSTPAVALRTASLTGPERDALVRDVASATGKTPEEVERARDAFTTLWQFALTY